jgi:hypothetical protein
MIRISVEAAQGAARYKVAVRAKSIGRALEIAGRQNPDREAKMAFPIDSETFFVRDAATMACTVYREAE